MKHAILITAYKNYDHLSDIISFFDDSFRIYIHIDRKSEIQKWILEELRSYTNVDLVSNKYKVNWGGVNHLKSILYLAGEALKDDDITRFHVISGHDYPIQSPKKFIQFFSQNRDKNYINYHSLPSEKWIDGGLNRLEYYNLYDILDAKKYRHYIFKLVKLQKKIGFKRRISSKIPKLYGGETWWSLNKQTMDYVLKYTKTHKYLIRRFKHSFCSEEMYVHTVVLNSPFSSSVVNDSLRYIDWSDRNGNFPANLDISDLDNLLNSNGFFARKFETGVSEELKAMLNKELVNK